MPGQHTIRVGFMCFLMFAIGWPFIIYVEYRNTKRILERSREGVLTVRGDRSSGLKSSRYYTGIIDSTNVFIKTKEDLEIGSSYPVLYDPNALADYARDPLGPFFGFRFGNKNESTFDIHLRHRGPKTFWYMNFLELVWIIGAYVQFRRIKRIRFVRPPSKKRGHLVTESDNDIWRSRLF